MHELICDCLSCSLKVLVIWIGTHLWKTPFLLFPWFRVLFFSSPFLTRVYSLFFLNGMKGIGTSGKGNRFFLLCISCFLETEVGEMDAEGS